MDIAYTAGIAIASVSGMGVIIKWLNSKTDKKQDKSLCDERSGHIVKELDEIKVTQKEILKEVRIRNGTH